MLKARTRREDILVKRFIIAIICQQSSVSVYVAIAAMAASFIFFSLKRKTSPTNLLTVDCIYGFAAFTEADFTRRFRKPKRIHVPKACSQFCIQTRIFVQFFAFFFFPPSTVDAKWSKFSFRMILSKTTRQNFTKMQIHITIFLLRLR